MSHRISLIHILSASSQAALLWNLTAETPWKHVWSAAVLQAVCDVSRRESSVQSGIRRQEAPFTLWSKGERSRRPKTESCSSAHDVSDGVWLNAAVSAGMWGWCHHDDPQSLEACVLLSAWFFFNYTFKWFICRNLKENRFFPRSPVWNDTSV